MTIDVQYVPPCGTATITGKLGICTGPGVGVTFFGAYVNDNTGKCVAAPPTSGTCSCPTGSTTPLKYPIALGSGGTGTLVICYP
jgi:hypothetical protein